MTGKIHSFETLGTVDGPGIRFVVFMQGCPMRCKYCHNPDTWIVDGGKEYAAEEVVLKILKYKNYITKGGVTLTGGEPLLQIDFATELFKLLKERGIHTAIDTSGVVFNEDNKAKFDELLKYTDLVLLDIKHIDSSQHKALTGHSNENVLKFAAYLSEKNIKVWIRHVLIDGITDDDVYLNKLRRFIDTLKNVEKVEVLPYHSMGVTKYDNLKIEYPLKGIFPPTKERIENAVRILTR